MSQQQRQAESARDARPFEWKVCQFRIGQIESMLTWLDLMEETARLPIDHLPGR
ncbi:MAG TPA: hypothetical protein PK954_01845 [Anaerolineales bacterium]|nr:hypothetical protein [Anaerolineales bacterium]